MKSVKIMYKKYSDEKLVQGRTVASRAVGEDGTGDWMENQTMS
jgi:hypothetical protein